jgi:hypothetical protein
MVQAVVICIKLGTAEQRLESLRARSIGDHKGAMAASHGRFLESRSHR